MVGIWWLASYPKSGNTWLRAVVATLVTGRPADINALGFLGPIASDRFRFDDALGLDSAELSLAQQTDLRPRAYEIWAAEAARPLYCKAHDACHPTAAGERLFPAAATQGAVYVVRDPRAVAVSLAHHTGRPLEEEVARLADPAAAIAASGDRMNRQLHQHLGSWSGHVQSWLAAPFPVHLLRYEDMHADPQTAFAGVAAFLGLPCGPEAVAAAVAATRFDVLRAQELAAGFAERPAASAAFFREGRTDGWRAALNPAQANRIVAAHGATMRRLGYPTAPEASTEPAGSRPVGAGSCTKAHFRRRRKSNTMA